MGETGALLLPPTACLLPDGSSRREQEQIRCSLSERNRALAQPDVPGGGRSPGERKSKLMQRTFPQNIEAECGVLGSLLIDPEAIGQIADWLRPQDFYRDAHRTIYAAILSLFE